MSDNAIEYNKSFGALSDILEDKESDTIDLSSFDAFVQKTFALSYPQYSFDTWHIHKVCNFVDDVCKTDSKIGLVVLPRYHLKSTLLGYAFSIYRMLKSSGDGLYISYKEELATFHLSNLKEIIRTNPRLSPLFQDMRDRSESGIYYRVGSKRVRIFSSGIFGMKRGLHTDVVTIVDDILGTVENPLNLGELEKAEKMFNQEVAQIPNIGCPMIIFGTVMDFSDLLFKLKDNPNIPSLWLPAVHPDPVDEPEREILWPARFSKEILERQKQIIGWKAFSTEFLLMPVLAMEAFITREELEPMIDKNLKSHSIYRAYNKEDKNIVAGLDIGKRKNPSHLVVFEDDGNGILTCICQEFWDQIEYVEQARRVTEAIQNIGIDKFYIDATRGEMEERNLPRECTLIKFTGRGQRNQTSYASDFARYVERQQLKLIDDDRFISQITCMSNSLKAPNTASGHADCVDEETEVLTETGWKFFKEVNYEDLICTLNPITFEIEYAKPSNIIIENYTGSMYYIDTTQINQLVTPNHKMYIRDGLHKEFNLINPGAIEGKQVEYKKDGLWNGVEQEFFEITSAAGRRFFKIPMDQFLKLVGYYVSEGCMQHDKDIHICQKSGWKSNRMFEDLKDLAFGKVTHGGDKRMGEYDGGINFCSRTFGAWAKQNLGTRSINKVFPKEFLNLSSRQLKIMLDAYILGDGSSPEWVKNGTSIGSSTISKVLADQLQEIALKVGWSANIYIDDSNIGRRGLFGVGRHRVYKVQFIRNKNTPCVHKHIKSDSWVDYEGKIYCVTVPNHIMYIRRKGKPVWTGNSFWSVALAIGAYQDYFAPDRKRGTTLLGSWNDTLSPKDNIPKMMDDHRCKVCTKRSLEILEDGSIRCNYCFTIFGKEAPK